MARPPRLPMRRRDVMLSAIALLSGCGGGVDSGGTGSPTTLAVGPISGFGSIIVNGVRFDDSTAQRVGDIDPGQALALGMQTEVLASEIVVEGGVASAKASQIRVRREILGPVQTLDAANGVLTVLGQTVAVVPTTVFDALLVGGLAAVRVADIVAVYATFNVATRRYIASRIERRSSATAYSLRGVVDSLQSSARTLHIGALTIDWSSVAPADPTTTLAVGSAVTFTLSTVPVAGVWKAQSLETGVAAPPAGAKVELEGRITAVISPLRFTINGYMVDATTASLPNGSAGLVPGARAEVKGNVTGGIVQATRVEIQGSEGSEVEPFEINGTVTAVDLPGMSFVVRGITVIWTAATRFEDGTANDLRANVTRVEVKGALSADGTRVVATLVHVER
ncbi:MAG: DUF5666 domain-containing protein [Acidobacteriota bacterium]